VLICASVSAQEFRALISGKVVDPSGAAIAGADVSVVSVATNVRSTTKSGADGNFVLPQLRPGTCAWSFNILRGGAVPLDRSRPPGRLLAPLRTPHLGNPSANLCS